MWVKRAKSANALFTNTVFGFIRKHEKAESIQVPQMIKYLILNDYLLKETIETYPCGIKELDQYASARFHYGSIKIDPQDESIAEYEWTLHLQSSPWGIADNSLIGLVMCPVQYTPSDLPDRVYGIMCSHKHYFYVIGSLFDPQYIGMKSARAKTVVMTFNVVNKDLLFDINGGEYCFKLKESDGVNGLKVGKCRLLVDLLGLSSDAVTLGNFSIKQR